MVHAAPIQSENLPTNGISSGSQRCEPDRILKTESVRLWINVRISLFSEKASSN